MKQTGFYMVTAMFLKECEIPDMVLISDSIKGGGIIISSSINLTLKPQRNILGFMNKNEIKAIYSLSRIFFF